MKLFNSVQFNKPKRNKFDLSHERKFSMKMGTLTPFFVQEVIPGDSIRLNTEMFMRFQPMIAPVMHRIRTKTDLYFVPNRLIWDNWGKFITGGDLGTDNPIHPYIAYSEATKANFPLKGLADYLGVPPLGTSTMNQTINISALPFRAYQLIWNEYYRDQNLQAELDISKTDGNQDAISGQSTMLTTLRQRAWEKDYFTSALPWAQKGGSVASPVSGAVTPGTLQASEIRKVTDNTLASSGPLTSSLGQENVNGNEPTYRSLTGEGSVEGEVNINELRRSVRLQEWLERNARAGSRYIESILAHFGVLSSDARLQRPEYLGGGVNPVVISEVLSTYQNADDTGYPQGTMSGHGISTGNITGFKRKFEEHGFIIGIMTVLPRTAYQQGLPKHFSRFDKFDYAWPSFAQLGEQEIKLKELYLDTAASNAEETFGYQSRYAEYKYAPTTVHGDMRTNLAFWHEGRIFQNKPVLNEQFIQADPDKRIFAVTDQNEDEIICQLYNRVDALRPLPYFNTPTL
ncbi:MAG: major capsid protein [Microvirus sp.]|nr:MAG: major capsid protein [Microvirus sp.]